MELSTSQPSQGYTIEGCIELEKNIGSNLYLLSFAIPTFLSYTGDLSKV